MKTLITMMLVSIMALATVPAEAGKRLGGGKSVGQQSSNVSKQQAAPTQATPPPAAPAPVAQPSRPWGAMLGGLAAGLGLAWLASSLGMGEAFANILMVMLIAVVLIAAIGWFMRRRMMNNSDTLAYQGAGAEPATNQPMHFQNNSMATSALPTTTWTIPADFDVVGFQSVAKSNFVSLQAAWDRADMAVLSNMLTESMLTEMKQQLATRDKNEEHRTAVISVDAKLLGIEELPLQYMASVEFTGIIQETVGQDPEQFKEIWNMTKSKSTDSGWVVAGIQIK